MDNLKQKTINAPIWRGIETFGSAGDTFCHSDCSGEIAFAGSIIALAMDKLVHIPVAAVSSGMIENKGYDTPESPE